MKLLRYPDLVGKGIVRSRMTLKRLIDAHGFPPGKLISPNSRVWQEDEIAAWLESRPTARKTELRAEISRQGSPT